MRKVLIAIIVAYCLLRNGQGYELMSRKEWIRTTIISTSISSSALLARPYPGIAKVMFDIERYGDKELKVASVNKLKQQIRNSLTKNPGVAPAYLELAVLNALSFDAENGTGGLDGSIAMLSDKYPSLKKAIDELLVIKRNVQRTNELSLADIIAFAGGEAVESAGGPRSTVQLGRYDGKTASTLDPSLSLTSSSGTDLLKAFKKAGLGAREMALMLAAHGELRRIAQEAKSAKQDQGDDEDDDEDDDDDDAPSFEDEIPVTFGTRESIFGELIGKGDFGTKYIDGLIKKKFANAPDAIASDKEVKSFIQRYGGNKNALFNDFSEAYQKVTLLGSQYTNRNS